MSFQAVLFDLWGTLILDPPERSLPRMAWRAGAVMDALASHDFRADVDDLTLVLTQTARELGNLQDNGFDLKAGGRADLFARLFHAHAGVEVPSVAFGDVEEAIGAMPTEYQPLEAPGAAESLAALKRAGFVTGLISNAGLTTAPNLRRIVDDYGMTPHLDCLVFSDDLGIAKPDARIFSECLTSLSLPASACAFVGDSPHNDIWGAQAAGLFAIQIGDRQREGVKPDATVELLHELLPLIQSFAASGAPVRSQSPSV